MPVSPPFSPPPITPNYWSFTTLSFDRSAAFPANPEFQNVFANDIQVFDINGDGHLDVVQVYSWIPGRDLPGIPIRVLLGDGDGGFTDGTTALFGTNVPLGDAASGSSVADFNGDGRLDLFISQSGERLAGLQNGLLLSQGASGMIDASATLPQITDFTHWSTAGDIDSDNDVDIFVHNLGVDDPYFLINNGTGGFARSDTQLPAALDNAQREYSSSLLFDADNDGDLDLFLGVWGAQAAFINTGAFQSLVLFNDGAGHFAQTVSSELPDPIWAANLRNGLGVQAVDITGDGYKDLLVLMDNNSGTNYVQILINNQAGGFVDETASRWLLAPQGGGGRYLHVIDVNADGALDVVLETGAAQRFFLNDGTGRFVPLPADFLFTNGGTYAFVPGDFNEDGRTDFFVRNFVNSWDDPAHITEFDWIALGTQPSGTTLTGDAAANAVLGVAANEILNGLAGDDVVFGAAGNDALNGGDGNDYLNGGAGLDTMVGGLGNDTYFVDSVFDVVTESAGAGTDTVNTTLASHTLGAEVEDLTYFGAAVFAGTGNALNNALTGGAGADTLNGAAGADSMLGRAGNDQYVVDNTGDVVTEASGEGHDTVYTFITYTLSANVEDLATATASAINLFGNGLANLIVGNGAVNGIDGGAGVDTMIGGGGNDLYFVDNIADVIIEGAGEGTADVVYTSLAFYQLGDNVEQLSVTAASGTFAMGNGLDNEIVGNAGEDALDGGGGVDTLIGGAGNDSYFVDNIADVIIEGASGGAADVAYTSLAFYHLGSNVEQLSVTTASGTYAAGNELDNEIVGNAGADALDGGGGVDTLIGGAGNDSYFVDNIADVIIEGASEGSADVVYTSLAFYQLGSNVEQLSVTAASGTFAAGNELVNLIVGNSGADALEGRAGGDVLVGNGGADTFIWNNASEGGDAIVDFAHGVDFIRVSAAGFGGGLVNGGAAPLVANSNPSSVGASFLYDTDDGRLFWDPDGAGGVAATLIATLSGNPTLTSSDIIIGP